MKEIFNDTKEKKNMKINQLHVINPQETVKQKVGNYR